MKWEGEEQSRNVEDRRGAGGLGGGGGGGNGGQIDARLGGQGRQRQEFCPVYGRLSDGASRRL